MHNVTPLAKDIILKCVSKDPNARPYFKNIVNDLLNSDDTLFLKESKREIEEFITQNLEFQQINDFDLSKKYKEGNELPQDLAMSAFLMKRAADENKMNAQFSYGKMLLNGTGVKENREEARKYLESKDFSKQMEYIMFAQEKYSNGETSMQYFDNFLQPDALYLLDEPEVSLSPANQVALAQEINNMARWLDCQFIIATHSPFMLGTLDAKIYNIDSKEYAVTKWSDLENVHYFYNFFKKNEKEFE